jgi:hypothetical protein
MQSFVMRVKSESYERSLATVATSSLRGPKNRNRIESPLEGIKAWRPVLHLLPPLFGGDQASSKDSPQQLLMHQSEICRDCGDPTPESAMVVKRQQLANSGAICGF